MMKITHHGGNCCGIKTISGLFSPDDNQARLTVKSPSAADQELNQDIRGQTVSSSTNMYLYAAPEETSLQRFDRYLDFLCEKRPYHIIEVAIAAYPESAQSEAAFDASRIRDFQTSWIPLLLQRGFKESVRNFNSNSGNIVIVYHAKIINGVIEGADYVKSYEEYPKKKASTDGVEKTTSRALRGTPRAMAVA